MRLNWADASPLQSFLQFKFTKNFKTKESSSNQVIQAKYCITQGLLSFKGKKEGEKKNFAFIIYYNEIINKRLLQNLHKKVTGFNCKIYKKKEK